MNMDWSLEDDPATLIGAETEVGNAEEDEEVDPGEYVGTPSEEQYEDAFEQLPEEEVERASGQVNPAHTPKPSSQDFTLLTTLGVGGYGKVYQVEKATGIDKGSIFAMKVLEKSKIVRSTKDTAHTKSERSVLALAKHPFIVDMKYAFQDKDHLYMVLEFCQGGELFSQLESASVIGEDLATFYLAEIALALGHLHSMDVIYRDLKPENILLTDRGHVKLTDFGLCKESIGLGDRTHTFCGTIDYMAPEIIMRHGHDKSVDWWSLGALLYDMVVGQPPFSSSNRTKTMEKIKSGKLTYPHYLTNQCRSLIKQLIKRDPRSRLGSGSEDVLAIKRHEFFRHIDWDKLLKLEVECPTRPVKFHSKKDASAFSKEFTNVTPRIAATNSTSSPPVWFDGFSYCSRSCQQQMMLKSPIKSPMKLTDSPSKPLFPFQDAVPFVEAVPSTASNGVAECEPCDTAPPPVTTCGPSRNIVIGFNVPGETPASSMASSGITTTTSSLLHNGYSASNGVAMTNGAYSSPAPASMTNGYATPAPMTNGYGATNGHGMANGGIPAHRAAAAQGFTTVTNGYAVHAVAPAVPGQVSNPGFGGQCGGFPRPGYSSVAAATTMNGYGTSNGFGHQGQLGCQPSSQPVPVPNSGSRGRFSTSPARPADYR